jgi:transcription elongation factor GreA
MDEKIFYITQQGLEKIKAEYDALKKIRAYKTQGEEAPRVLHSEDLDPEYVAFHEDMELLEIRISELENMIRNAHIINKPPKGEEKIVLPGATVLVDIGRGKISEFTITGTFEADPSLGKISNESPIGKALLGHKAGDKILIDSQEKTIYKIKKIKYRLS